MDAESTARGTDAAPWGPPWLQGGWGGVGVGRQASRSAAENTLLQET